MSAALSRASVREAAAALACRSSVSAAARKAAQVVASRATAPGALAIARPGLALARGVHGCGGAGAPCRAWAAESPAAGSGRRDAAACGALVDAPVLTGAGAGSARALVGHMRVSGAGWGVVTRRWLHATRAALADDGEGEGADGADGAASGPPPKETPEERRARRKRELAAQGYVAAGDLPLLRNRFQFVTPDSEEERAAAEADKPSAGDFWRSVDYGDEDVSQEREDVARKAALADLVRMEADDGAEHFAGDPELALDTEDEWSFRDIRMREQELWMTFEAERIADLEERVVEPEVKRTWANKALIKFPMRDAQGRAYATGRRKTSAARVWIREGDGSFFVNRQPLHRYFASPSARRECLAPFIATRSCGAFDVWLTVKGGGVSGQAGAIKHGVARALSNYDPFLRPVLKRLKLLRRDPRMVERKKPGQPKARKKFQWVKR